MSVATAYAKALYEAAKESSASPDQLERDLDSFLRVVSSSKEAGVALLGPVTTGKEKAALINEFSARLGFLPLTSQFLTLLAHKGRLPRLSQIRDAFSAVRISSEGGVLGRLVAAEQVSDADVSGLSQAFGKKLGRKVSFRVETDPGLLAGMKVTVSGVTYDGTLRSQLQQLRDRVLLGASAR